MPELSRARGDASERLRGLDALTSQLDHDESDQFRAYMLGALCQAVDQDQWEIALGNAMEWSNTWLRSAQLAADKRNEDEPSS